MLRKKDETKKKRKVRKKLEKKQRKRDKKLAKKQRKLEKKLAKQQRKREKKRRKQEKRQNKERESTKAARTPKSKAISNRARTTTHPLTAEPKNGDNPATVDQALRSVEAKIKRVTDAVAETGLGTLAGKLKELEAERERLQEERQVQAMLVFAPVPAEGAEPDVPYVRKTLGALVRRIELEAHAKARSGTQADGTPLAEAKEGARSQT